MALFGVLPINKSAGRSSRVLVTRVEGLIRNERVGHTGTLDPMATGVLLMAIGNATRLVEFSHELTKGYTATFEFGKTSDTLDATGQITELAAGRVPTAEELQIELRKWLGRVKQIPPQYSALMIDGRRAYKMARRGVEFELAPREVEIFKLEVLDYSYPFLRLHIDCGSGTYVRAIGRDIARGLGTEAIMTELTRTRVGTFELSECVEVSELRGRADVQRHLASPKRLIQDWFSVVLNDEQVTELRYGAPLRLDIEGDWTNFAAVDQQGDLVGLMTVTQEPKLFRSIRVFHAEYAANQPRRIKTKHNPES